MKAFDESDVIKKLRENGVVDDQLLTLINLMLVRIESLERRVDLWRKVFAKAGSDW